MSARKSTHSFGPIVLVGLASASLMAIAASQTWLSARFDGISLRRSVEVSGSDAAPLALALALVCLASWGVILVSGTRARQISIVLAGLATLGTLVVAASLWSGTEEVVARTLANQTVEEITDVNHRPWYWITGIAGLAQLAVLLLAFRAAPRWPLMSERYDAPVSGPSTAAEPQGDLDLWKALDQGQDPTAGSNP